jgi:acid phosphatase type 7
MKIYRARVGSWLWILPLLGPLLFTSAASAGLKVYAAGDIAECDGDPLASPAAATAKLIPIGAPVLVIGDTTYPTADAATLASCYGPTWGRFRATTYAVPGNHDYANGTTKDFLDYFGARVPNHAWFRAPLGGTWWVIGLDSDLTGAALAAQDAWLKSELRRIRGDHRCVIALWHHALFSTGLHAGDGVRMKPSYAALDQAGADVVLSGHEHFYEAFDPLDAEGQPRATGIREFVVGTGGAKLRDMSLSSRHRAFALEHGVLELELDTDRYHWAFRTVSGQVRDQGEAPCRRAAISRSPAPTT